jgi:putative MATE family efflux protein
MVISGAQILMHLTMNFLFVFPHHDIGSLRIPGLGLGLRGAAMALTISTWIAAVVYVLYSGKTPLGEQWRIQRPHLDWSKRILRIAAPAALMGILRVFALTAYTLVLKIVPNGSVAIAAMGVSFSIEAIMFMPSFGLSTATAALVGQSLGMKKPDRAEKLAWIAAHHAGLVTAILALPIFIFAPTISHLLVGDKKDVIDQAAMLLRMLCSSEVGFAYAMVMLGAMQGAGDTVKPFWITLITMWLLRLPMCVLFSLASGQVLTSVGARVIAIPFGLAMGATGTWLAIAITQGTQGIMSVIAFRQGTWKQAKV